MDIFNEKSFKSSTSDQYRYFKIVEWVKCDARERQIHFKELLSFVSFNSIPYHIFHKKIDEDRIFFNNADFTEIYVVAAHKFTSLSKDASSKPKPKKLCEEVKKKNKPNPKTSKPGPRKPSTSK